MNTVMKRRLGASLAAIALTAGGLGVAGCGGDSSSASSSVTSASTTDNGVASLTASEILTKSMTAAKEATSVTVSGSVPDDSGTITIDLALGDGPVLHVVDPLGDPIGDAHVAVPVLVDPGIVDQGPAGVVDGLAIDGCLALEGLLELGAEAIDVTAFRHRSLRARGRRQADLGAGEDRRAEGRQAFGRRRARKFVGPGGLHRDRHVLAEEIGRAHV